MLYLCNVKREVTMKNILTRICLTAAVLTALTLPTSCDKDDNEEQPHTRTVLIYMSAENSLSPDSENDLMEIKEGSKALTDDDQLLVWYDRGRKDELPWLARIVNGELRDSMSIADMLISDKDDYSSNPNVFEKVLSYAFGQYPATEGYGLTLWGHANGWVKMDSLAYKADRSRGYGIDNGKNSSDYDSGPWLNIPTIRRILEKQPHLEFILSDCCNFMCLESIYELRKVTDYVVGSPAEIPDIGAPYDKVVPEMFKRQNAAQGIMKKYAESLQNYLPLSVAKTEGMLALAEATRTVLAAIYSRLDSEYPDMTGLIHYYNDNRSRFLPYYNFLYDAGDFVKKYATEAEYKTWKTVLDRVVVDKAFAKSWTVNKPWHSHYSDFEMTEERYHGVSMFVPQDPKLGYYYEYNEDIKIFGWYWVVWE